MIISDKYEFVIANPPKTATTSLHGLVDRWLNKGGDPKVLRHMRGDAGRSIITRHRLAPPDVPQYGYTRYMMVRHPLGRLASMYEFFRLRQNDQRWVAPHIQEMEAKHGRQHAWLWFLEFVLTLREEPSVGWDQPGLRGVHGIQPFMWIDTQAEMMAYMEGWDIDGSRLPWADHQVFPLRLERFEEDWVWLTGRHGAEELYGLTLPKRNAVPDAERLFQGVTGYMTVPGASSLLYKIHGGRGEYVRQVRAFGR